MKSGQHRTNLQAYLRFLNIGAFFSWWARGLAAWLPESLRRAFTPSVRYLAFEIGTDDKVTIVDESAGEREELGQYPLHSRVTDDLRRQLARYKNHRRIVRLPQGQALTKTITLPAAAVGNLRQVVGFELDRLTPFPPDKLYYDACVQRLHTDTRRIEVRFVAAQRATVDQRLEQLAAVGVKPDSVSVGTENSINLLPQDKQARVGRGGARLRWLLASLCLGLLMVAAVLPLWQQRMLVIGLMPAVAAAQQKAEIVIALRDELEHASEAAGFLQQKRLNNRFVIDLVDELTRVLPDGTWVEQLTIKDSEVQVRGQSQEAASLVALLEASDLFQGVTFRSPVINDRRTGRDRFFISARIIGEQSS